MKCTTKILIGILLSGMVVAVVGTILFCTVEWPRGRMLLDGELTQVDVPPFRVVNVSFDTGKGVFRKIAVEGSLSIVQSVDGKNSLSYPKRLAHYLSVVTENDTLRLVFKKPASKVNHSDGVFLEISKMVLTADSSLVAVQSEAPSFSVELKKLESDSISLRASFLTVDSCRFRSLSVQQAWNLKLRNSCIQHVFLDLDGISEWSVRSCQIENEYLTGSKRHYNALQKGECQRVYWNPKKPDAALNFTLEEAACVLLPN